ncbi:MAG: hypothetical protein QNL05_13845 [Gammaproteobacteria bacterium]|nr:hypothetical protein [Gammaproteobacteria bacterium]MDX2488592.1 hypothetical protein [Gammaproteobacteria bacterium]
MSNRTQIIISPDHPGLAGHFPGNPVVPGVVILDHVRECIKEWKCTSIKVSTLKSVKFLSPVMMKANRTQTLDIILNEKITTGDSQVMKIEFRCMKNDELIALGLWYFSTDTIQ